MVEKQEAIKFIKASLMYLQGKFTCTFKCEFNPITYTFLIEDVMSSDTEENKILYKKETQKIVEDFERIFPVMLEFIGNEYKLKNPIFEL
jgi:hypothetical protein